MSSKFTFDTSKFTEEVLQKFNESSVPLAEILGNAQVANNQLRMDEGVGLDDKPMPLYSKDYAEKRKERGERTDVRNLVQTGRMRGAMAVQKTEKTDTGAVSEVGFTDARARELAFYNQQRTPFFGISEEDGKKLSALGQIELTRLIEG